MSAAAACQRERSDHLNFVLAVSVFLVTPCVVAQAANPATPPAPAAPATTPADAAPAPPPAWDVSTVKPSSPDARGSMFQITFDGIKITNVPLWTMVREAFGLENDRLFGGPGWSKTTNFDVEAKVAPEDAPKLKGLTLEQRRQMMVALLEERFGLKYHRETRDLPMYELVVTKGGAKLQASKPDAEGADQGPGPAPSPGRHMLMMRGRGHIESTGSGLAGLVRLLSGQLGRTVVDKTGLKGDFDYKLDWTPDDATTAITKSGNPVAGDNAALQDAGGPSLFTALEEQLGLKLEATKGPVDVVVIDHMEPPTAN